MPEVELTDTYLTGSFKVASNINLNIVHRKFSIANSGNPALMAELIGQTNIIKRIAAKMLCEFFLLFVWPRYTQTDIEFRE